MEATPRKANNPGENTKRKTHLASQGKKDHQQTRSAAYVAPARPLGARGLEMSTEIFVMGRAPGRAGVSRVRVLLDLHLADADEVHDHQL